MSTSAASVFRTRAFMGVTIATLALALLAALLGGNRSALAQHPEESHCGDETGGGSLSGFLSHAQVDAALQRIERTSQAGSRSTSPDRRTRVGRSGPHASVTAIR